MKVLLISDSVSPFSSSGRVTHKIAKVFNENGVSIRIINYGKPDINTNLIVKYFESSDIIANKMHQLLVSDRITGTINYIKEYQPDIVHFASFNYGSSKFILNYLHKNKIKTVLQPWIHDFYCAQMFGYRNGFLCNACSNGNFLNAIRYGCSSKKTGLLGVLNRSLLRYSALKADIFLSSNSYMDKILINYGILENNIKRLAIPFDNSILKEKVFKTEINNSFIFYGQSKDFKGFYLMKEIALKCPEINFKLCPIGDSFDHAYFQNVNNIELITTFSASHGLFDAINNSLGVILPTLWPTTTEYSLYEAMYLSKPIIAFNVGAHFDLLKHRENAMVVEAGDIDGFINNIREVASNSSLRNNIGRNAYNFVESIADESIFFSQLMAIYNS